MKVSLALPVRRLPHRQAPAWPVVPTGWTALFSASSVPAGHPTNRLTQRSNTCEEHREEIRLAVEWNAQATRDAGRTTPNPNAAPRDAHRPRDHVVDTAQEAVLAVTHPDVDLVWSPATGPGFPHGAIHGS
jgi:hypothetical protein